MRFLGDEQLPASLALWLVEHGHDAQHVGQLTMEGASDEAIWRHAVETKAVIVTKDRDFVEWAVTRRAAATVLWLRFGNVKTPILLEHFANVWPRVLADLAAGSRVIEAGRP